LAVRKFTAATDFLGITLDNIKLLLSRAFHAV
jgi:hypothetical protein